MLIVAPLSEPAVKLTVSEPEPETILVIVGAAGSWATRTEVIVGAVKVNVAAFVAISVITPPFKETLDALVMPSMSISESLVCTV